MTFHVCCIRQSLFVHSPFPHKFSCLFRLFGFEFRTFHANHKRAEGNKTLYGTLLLKRYTKTAGGLKTRDIIRLDCLYLIYRGVEVKERKKCIFIFLGTHFSLGIDIHSLNVFILIKYFVKQAQRRNKRT